MTLKEFFMGRAVVLSIILVIGLAIFGYQTYFSNPEVSEPIPEKSELSNFNWRYEKADSLNPDGISETEVYLEATYVNGVKEIKLIDTTPGSCNDLPDVEKDSLIGTTNIQCYSAGLGYRFKITKGENSYLVKRKTFEEASPDYNPPQEEYEVVAEFPLVK